MKAREIYQCAKCGNQVEVVELGGGVLTCCDQKMDHVAENSTDAAQAKHIPVLEKVENGYKVTVGEVEHPMTAEHYINWIELIADKEVYRAELKPTDKPVAFFCLDKPNVTARAYCNLHGLWSKES